MIEKALDRISLYVPEALENAELYNALIRSWGESSRLDASQRLRGVIERMRFNGVVKSAETYKTLIRLNLVDSVMIYLDEMVNSGFDPDIDDVSVYLICHLFYILHPTLPVSYY